MIEQIAAQHQAALKRIEELESDFQVQLAELVLQKGRIRQLEDEVLTYKGKQASQVKDLQIANLTSRLNIYQSLIGFLVHKIGRISMGIDRKTLLEFVVDVSTQIEYKDNSDKIMIRNKAIE